MNARLTMLLRAVVIGSFMVAFTAVAQNEPQQRPDEHQAGQRPTQNAGHAGQPQQGRPQQGRPQQQQPQRPAGAQQNGHPQPTQHAQPQPQRQQNGQPQSRPQPQQGGQSYRPQQRGAEQQHVQPQTNHGQPQSRAAGNRPQQWGHAPARRPSYNFRPNDRNTLLRYYGSRLSGINRARRPVFRIGGYLPYGDLGYFSAVPPGAWGGLPPIPPGYVAGYWDGYVIVYDPNTGYILYVSDLL